MRNYKNESNWAKNKYERIEIKLDKTTGLEFKRKLNEKGITISEFFKEKIKNFLKNT